MGERLVVEIHKAGRWSYRLTLRRGDLGWPGYDYGKVLGLRRARRRADRLLEHLRQRDRPRPPVEVVEG